ncbi:MAG: UDP-N-acetylmuramoyl-tripeptide--D-alanyl-D-alanine ligase [Oceanicoccus sp.]|jgi:UDP-N-acetylmuramoyl-tripeptide--D-alanyl-D-alanine ligase
MMRALSLADIAVATDGDLSGDACFENVSTDSRQINSGDLFVALSGDNFNGNQFALQAASAGAIGAVVNEDVALTIPTLKVKDCRFVLGLIARQNRRQFKAPVVALTGSAGKTTCKEMVASILSEVGEVLATVGNLNNEIGVPLTLLKISPQHKFAVIEMGASKAGDIAYLTQFAEPTVAILTNAMPAHIESFGSLEIIAKTKGEIFQNLPTDGFAVINRDDVFYQQWLAQAGAANIVSFSKQDAAADFYASAIAINSDGSTRFRLHAHGQHCDIKLALLGQHNIANAVAASAAAMAAGASLSQVKMGLGKVAAVNGRLKAVSHQQQLIIDDSYNASPGSVKAAIDVLAGFSGHRCLVLGAMSELGEMAEQGHREVAAYARQQGIEQLLAVGDFAPLQLAEFAGDGKGFTDMAELLAAVGLLKSAAVVLVKGSRSAQMERVVMALLSNKEGA